MPWTGTHACSTSADWVLQGTAHPGHVPHHHEHPLTVPLLSPEALRVEEAELQGLCQLPVHQAVPQKGSAPAHRSL